MIIFVHTVVALAALAGAFLAARQAAANRRDRTLLQLHEAIEDEQNPTELGRQLLAAMCEASGCTAALLYFEQKGLTGVRLKASFGLDQKQLGEAAVDPMLKQRLLAKAGAEGATLLKLDPDNAGSFLKAFSSVLAVSLPVANKQVGMVILLRRTGAVPRPALTTLARFAPRAAAALENARLYQQNRSAAEENARLYLNMSKLFKQATVDSLTGLHNRGFMQVRLREEIKKAWRFKHPLAVVLVNLDLSREAHEVGQKTSDEILREASRLVRETARDYDIICRYSGEEILLILPHTEPEGAAALAERLRQEIAAAKFQGGLQPVCNLGVAGMSRAGLPAGANRRLQESLLNTAADKVLGLAESALERARTSGGNLVEIAAVMEPGDLGAAAGEA